MGKKTKTNKYLEIEIQVEIYLERSYIFFGILIIW